MIDPSIKKEVEYAHRVLAENKTKEEFISNTNKLLKGIKKERPRDLTRFFNWRIEDVLDLGFFLTVKENNYNHLNDAYYTYSRLSYFDSEYYSRKKREKSILEEDKPVFNSIISARAANDDALVNLLLENSNPLKFLRSKYCTSYTNIILGIELEDENKINQGIIDAEELLNQKLTIYEKHKAEMLLSIAKKDIEKLNKALQDAIDTYTFYISRQQMDYLYRYLPIHILGLIKIAEKYIGSNFYNDFKVPESKIWYPEWFSLIKKGKTGKRFMSFTGEASYLNEMIDTLEVL